MDLPFFGSLSCVLILNPIDENMLLCFYTVKEHEKTCIRPFRRPGGQFGLWLPVFIAGSVLDQLSILPQFRQKKGCLHSAVLIFSKCINVSRLPLLSPVNPSAHVPRTMVYEFWNNHRQANKETLEKSKSQKWPAQLVHVTCNHVWCRLVRFSKVREPQVPVFYCCFVATVSIRFPVRLIKAILPSGIRKFRTVIQCVLFGRNNSHSSLLKRQGFVPHFIYFLHGLQQD